MIKFGRHVITRESPCFLIAEIGHNHQGDLEIAKNMIKTAAECGAHAVKLQKRDNKNLFTKEFYNRPYDNENSYGATYGEHREALEFGIREYVELKKTAEELGMELFATAFDFQSVDFLEELNVHAYKIASGDLNNIPLIDYIARLGKPIFLSTGAGTLKDIRLAYERILKHHDQLCIFQCTAAYPCEYEDLHLNVIHQYLTEFPDAVVGLSSHDNGILAPVVAYMMGANVIEKHFTLNRSWKGTDHKFSLEPIGLRKLARDLKRVDLSKGVSEKKILDIEKAAKEKMGKSIYLRHACKAGTILTEKHLVLKTPAKGISPNDFYIVMGKTVKIDLPEETCLLPEHLVW